MTAYAGTMGRRRRRSGLLGRLLMVCTGMFVAALAGAPVAYVLWPAPKPVAPDAPSLPIAVGGVTFNVPPGAIRVAMQRRPGAQARIDLAFVWPTLAPPASAIKGTSNAAPDTSERLFVTIAASDGTLAPMERLKSIYPRYTAAAPVVGADGLTVQSFRPDTPYLGEDLIYHASAPDRFLLRCTAPKTRTPAMCLHERRIEGADLTARFPRAWLSDWRTVAEGIERLIASFGPAAAP
jgi:hypothetical protein